MALKSNTKYTAAEILKESGIAKAEEQVGKVAVRIAGIAGINSLDQVINIQEGIANVDVQVGSEVVTIPVEADDAEHTVSEGARIALDTKGIEATKAAEKLQELKAELKADEEKPKLPADEENPQ